MRLLRNEAIQATVVGGALGNAAGWIPAAEAAPRIWVRESDRARAREIIDAHVNEPRAEEPEADDLDVPEDAEEPFEDGDLGEEPVEAVEEGGEPPAFAKRSGAIARVLCILGAACIVLGARARSVSLDNGFEVLGRDGGGPGRLRSGRLPDRLARWPRPAYPGADLAAHSLSRNVRLPGGRRAVPNDA